ncbi:ac26-like protein [Peridroma alphabaculovirus]|uniref:Ac26-like protein n=1 Tax=Peridroma alphabaculovirus TaxID=1346829 RepID=A0A068LMX9_9ABAC|nr:ac26-like protein [Peridroma alphabaculovirus]AIE47851.1 ac26-like protein [Peridroma alphabaculovirus]
MEFTTSDLLKNTSFSAKHHHKFVHYMTLHQLAKGLVPQTLTIESLKELEKLNFQIDPLTDYITNIFDYDLYISNNDPSTVHVVAAGTKNRLGTLAVNMLGEQLTLTAHVNDDGQARNDGDTIGCTEAIE